jgi:hypothetical protein
MDLVYAAADIIISCRSFFGIWIIIVGKPVILFRRQM